MKKHLREHFSIIKNGKIIVGPCEVEVTEEEFKNNEHKLEDAITSETAPADREKKHKKGK